MGDLIVGQYVSNDGTRRYHLYVVDRPRVLKTLCGLFWSTTYAQTLRLHDVEVALRQLSARIPHCARCKRNARKFRDPITRLGEIAR